MTVTQDRPTARPVADDAWLGGAAEPAGDGPTRTTPAARALARGPVVPPYRPVPRKPATGTRWPFILVEGGEYSGKSTHAFKLAAVEGMWSRVLVIAIGEDVDEFGEIAPDMEILPHDGTWHQIMGCVDYAREAAEAAVAAGDLPVLVIVDSMTKVWKLLSEWAENRARNAPSNRTKLEADPNDEPEIGTVFWNAANKRHDRLVTKLITMPAVVVSTARGRWVSEIDAKGNPTKTKVYSVQAQKDLGFSTTAMIRLEVGKYPTITGLRRVRGGIQPGNMAKAVTVDPRTERFAGVEFSLEWLLGHVLKFDPATARVATTVEPRADAEPADGPPARPVSAPPADADEAPGRARPAETRPAATR
ncbi:hypothetical protein AB0B88_16095 [Micromonospora haikouensis]|uniref:hypothetical protein n=1 Tax=Micromonospora haikouensis TaxID=686309 RepID=UPI003410DCE9